MRHLQRWSTLLPAALVLAACSTFNPSPPPSRPVPPPPPVQPSSLALPVSIDKVSIQQLLEQEIPGSLADSSHVEVPVKLLVTTAHVGIDYDYHVSRGPIAFSTSGATLAAATALTGQIHAKARAGGFEGSVAMAAHVGVHGVLGVQPDYRLQASFSKDLTIDSAEMPVGFTVDGVHVGTSVSVRGLLENRLNPVLDEVVSRLDAKVAAIDIRTPLADAWQKIGQPVLVDRKDNAWLTITPLAVSFSGLSSDDTSIRATLGLQALVTGTIGQKPDPVNTGSLPNLSDPAPSSGFHFYFPVTTTYAELQDQVRKTVVGNTYTVAKNATVKVTDISLSGNGDAVTVALKFSAHVPQKLLNTSGVLYFVGTPKVDESTQTLSVEDFNYDVDTRNMIVKGADWLLHDEFVRAIQKKLSWKLDGTLQNARSKVNAYISDLTVAKGVHLAARVDTIRIAGVYSSPAVLTLTGVFDGQASVTVDAAAQLGK